jgi:hypothetical protein
MPGRLVFAGKSVQLLDPVRVALEANGEDVAHAMRLFLANSNI